MTVAQNGKIKLQRKNPPPEGEDLRSDPFAQRIWIEDADTASLHMYQPLLGEAFEHARDDLTGGIGILRDLLLRHADFRIAGAVEFFEQKGGQPLVESEKENLLNGLYYRGKALGQELIHIAFDIDVFFSEAGKESGRKNKQLAVFFGQHMRVKGDLMQDTICGQDTGIVFPEAEEQDFSAFLGEKKTADLS